MNDHDMGRELYIALGNHPKDWDAIAVQAFSLQQSDYIRAAMRIAGPLRSQLSAALRERDEAREALQLFVELAASNEEWMRADGPTPEMLRLARAALATTDEG